ncbi:MAG: hypothetical protein VYC39_18650, partial [Myxococcota bacterium]|nr:hypothetical protein [Myxococcota bacterium]
MCPTPIKPSAALPTSLADPVNPSGATPAKPTVSGLSSVDAMDRNASTVGAAKPVLAATTIPGIQESFPLADLSQLEAKGVQGQTLMLDAGSLRGLKLQVRRVKDEGKPGFEIVFRLTDSKIDALEERFEKSGAKSQQLTFRSTETDDDGICNYTAEKETIKHSVIHAPTDLEQNADEWALRVEGKKGGHIELATNEAAHALRGLVRVHLRGTDKQCTQQLDSLIKTLGLGFLFAPPTPKSKRVNMLMRVLFQHDHAKAIELSKGDLSKLKVSDLEKALETAGISKSRLDNMEYAEVFSGHFTVIDPMQSQEMAQAGARYLYSTLGNAEHVLSILQTGQKSSMQRYFEGAIINGMSTNSDFATGGAVGVFARVVTQDSIYENRAWTGRTFKLVQNYEQFARTDWYGWDSDKFGRRWDLNSDENFGPSLIAKIDNEGNYRATNEVVFTAGNDPKNIDRVVSTDITERQELIELLREHDYVPHNGMSLEKFVVYSPNFLLHGPSPYEFTNAKEFIKIAKDEAKSGNANKLKWYLLEGPDSSERSKLEGELLLSNEPKLSEIACFTVKRRGRFIQTGKSLHKTLSSLKKSRKKDTRKTFNSLVKNSAPAFLRANDDFVLDMLTSNVKSVSSYRPYGIPRGEWSSIISEIVADQKSSKWSNTLELVMDERGLFLLQQKDKLFMQLLKESDVVGMSKSQRWETQQLNKLIKEKDITPQFLLYYAQKTLRGEGQELERRILEADRIHTHKLLDLMTEANEGFQQNPTALAATLSALPNDSELKQHILKTHAKTLLQMTSPEILDVIEDASASSSSTRPTFGLTVYQLQNLFSDFLETNKPLNVEFLRRVGEKCGSKISAQPETRIALASQPDLYDFSEPLNFAKNAIQDLKNRDKSYFQLTALISSQNVSEEAKE